MEIEIYGRIRGKIITTVLLFSLIPMVFLVFFLLYVQFDKIYTDKIINTLKTMVYNKKRSIDLFFEERIAQIKTLAYTHNYETLSNDKYLSELLNVVQSTSKSIVDLGIINQDGEHVAYAGPYKLKGVNYKNEQWFHEVLFKEIYISDVFMGFRKFPHIIIALMRKDGGKFWILRATIDSNVFNSLVQGAQVGEKGDAYLVNSDSVLQTPSRFGSQVLSKIDFLNNEVFNSIIDEKVLHLNKIFVGLSRIDIKKWHLVITKDGNEELSQFNDVKIDAILILIVFILIIIAGTFMVSKSIIKGLILSEKKKSMIDANLMQSSKMAALGKLAAGVAHEINNPLALIKESAGWIKDLLSEEEQEKIKNFVEYEKMANKIELHVERARSVTHRMLGFARRLEPAQENVDFNMLADQTVSFLESEALHRNIKIEKNLLKDIPLITTDTAQVQQVILNILDNAIDAIGKNGTIGLRTGYNDAENKIFLAISDTGVGIPQEEAKKIFDPFYTTKRPGDGTGLGLAISYNIIEKLGGKIEVDSTVGVGSTFTIYLPIRRIA
ncbi:MAG: two-component sensor histidine kinase [Desulfobacterales bacterium]|nr:two-component sensor histidine kinase [Desulfobacterales bacterium]